MSKTTKRHCEACSMIARGVKFRREPAHTCNMHVATDNHQWIKDEEYVDSSFKARHVCKVCECERLTYLTYKPTRAHYIYSRGCIFGFSSRPDCVDWNDRETLNRIDQ